MKNRRYYDFITESVNKVYIDVLCIESFESEGHILIIHMDSGVYHRLKLQSNELTELFEKIEIA